MVFEMYPGDSGRWCWRLKDSDGKPIADSRGSYYNPNDCLNDIRLVQQSSSARVVQLNR